MQIRDLGPNRYLPPPRPDFKAVLTVLGYLGCGLGIIVLLLVGLAILF